MSYVPWIAVFTWLFLLTVGAISAEEDLRRRVRKLEDEVSAFRSRL